MSTDQTLLMRLIIDQRQAVAGLKAATKAADVMGTSFQRVGKAANRAVKPNKSFSNGLRSVSQQMSQVAQQSSITGDYIGALAIQLPDLALGFGVAGTLIGAVAGSLLMAAKNADLFTNQSEKLKDSIKGLTEGFGDLRDIYKDFARSTTGELFGEQIRRGEIAAALHEIGIETDNVLDSYGALFDADIGNRIREIATMVAEFGGKGAASQRRISEAVGDFREEFDMTVESAKELQIIMHNLDADMGLEVNVEAARQLEERLFDIRNTSEENYVLWKQTHDLLKVFGGELASQNKDIAARAKSLKDAWAGIKSVMGRVVIDVKAQIKHTADIKKNTEDVKAAFSAVVTAMPALANNMATLTKNSETWAKNVWDAAKGIHAVFAENAGPYKNGLSTKDYGGGRGSGAVQWENQQRLNEFRQQLQDAEDFGNGITKGGGGGATNEAELKALKDIKQAVEDYEKSVKSLWDTMGFAVTDGVTDIFSQLSEDIVDGQADWRDYAAIAIRAIGKIADAWAQAKIAEMFGTFGQGSGGAASGIGKFISGILGGGGGFSMMAKGDIVTGPTKAIIGEAGPEAVFPVTRMPNGDLGVGVTGGGGAAKQTINIYNNAAGAEVTTGTGRDGSIEIFVRAIGREVTRQIRSGGTIARQLEQNYGLRRQGT